MNRQDRAHAAALLRSLLSDLPPAGTRQDAAVRKRVQGAVMAMEVLDRHGVTLRPPT